MSQDSVFAQHRSRAKSSDPRRTVLAFKILQPVADAKMGKERGRRRSGEAAGETRLM
jgi:hypothetical protein